MKVKKVEYPTPLSELNDVENDNIDVFVELEDGSSCTVVVSTPKNYYQYMEREGVDYYCGAPDIIVKRLTEENIRNAINKYASDNAYWLKFYHVAGNIDIDKINEILKEENINNNEIMKLK
jgi:predicted phosphodiesterase